MLGAGKNKTKRAMARGAVGDGGGFREVRGVEVPCERSGRRGLRGPWGASERPEHENELREGSMGGDRLRDRAAGSCRHHRSRKRSCLLGKKLLGGGGGGRERERFLSGHTAPGRSGSSI
jgi:hypothetical protein